MLSARSSLSLCLSLASGVAGAVVGGVASDARGQTIDTHAVDVAQFRTVLHDDVRVLWLGDSFALPYAGRVAGAALLAWRMDDWTSFWVGDGPNWFFTIFDEQTTGFSQIWSSNNYRLFDSGPQAEARYALPLWRGRERYFDGTGSGVTDLIRYRVLEQRVASGYSGRFADPGETVRVRPTLLAPPDGASMPPRLWVTGSGGTTGLSFDPSVSTRAKAVEGFVPGVDRPTPPAPGQIFAAPFDTDVEAISGGEVRFFLGAEEPEGTDAYVMPAGFVGYKVDGQGERVPGLYHSVLADGSWSYAGFGSDVPSGTPGFPSKVYSREQLAHWLDATTIDPAQPLVVVYHVAVEDISQAEAQAAMEAMIDQTEAAAADAGIGPVSHLLAIPYLHRVDGADNPGRFPEQRDAAFAVAAARANVGAVSIYDATDGQSFDGNPDSRAWLAANGYDAFRYGSNVVDLAADGGGSNGGLLDAFRSHTGSGEAAAFFAHIIENEIVGACPADFAAPYGVLDLADITGWIQGFMAQTPMTDAAEPWNVWDLQDILHFTTAFAAGCQGN